MADPVSTLRIAVVPSPETNDHEVRLLDGDDDIISRFDNTMMGLDPEDLLTSSCPLLPRDGPHTATIGRCGCGVTGCGSVEVVIERNHDVVIWRAPTGMTTVRFLAEQYEREIGRALGDFSWETPDRTAARLISSGIDRAALASRGFEYLWSSGSIGPGSMTIAMVLSPGPYQVLVHLQSETLSPEGLAERCLEALRADPSSWSNVTWYPQATGLPAPSLAGAGWRNGTAS
jgi:hypothetical protein